MLEAAGCVLLSNCYSISRTQKKLNTEKELFAVHTIWNIYSASLNARACMWKKVVRCA